MAPGHAVVGTNIWKKNTNHRIWLREPLLPPNTYIRYIIELQIEQYIYEIRTGILLLRGKVGKEGEFLTTVNYMVGRILSLKMKIIPPLRAPLDLAHLIP